MSSKIRKKGLLFFVLITAASPLFAQDTKPAKHPILPGAYPDANLAVYRNAMALHDYGTAIHALHYMIAANPTGAPHADTLALLYAQTGQYLQASLLADVQLSTSGYTNMRMEVKAMSNKKLDNPIIAINSYNVLYEKTKNPIFGFEKLQLEYAIKRLAEASNTANQLLKALPPNDNTQLQVIKLDKTTQSVLLRSGILNLQAAVFISLNQKGMAQEALKEALLLAPDFEQAKNNLKAIQALADNK